MRNFLVAALALLSGGASVTALEPGVYTFFSSETGQVLDIWAKDSKDGGSLSTAQWAQGNNQAFAIQTDNNQDFGIAAFHTLKGLTVTDAKKDVPIIQKSYLNAPNQQWKIVNKGKGLVAFQSKVSGKFLTVGAKAGDKVIQANGNGKNNQLFRPFRVDHTLHTPIKDGAVYTFINRGSSLPLEIAGKSKDNNAKLLTWDNNNSQAQQFTVVASRSSPEFVRLKNINSGRFLACNRGGNVIVQEDKKHGDRGQLWRFVETADGSYVIENQAARNAITVGKKGDVAKHNKADYNNKNQQFFVVEIL